MYEIKKNQPIPSDPPRAKYPVAKMEVGDSFTVETDNPKSKSSAIRRSINFWRTKTGLDVKFTIRTVEGGIQVWRTK